MKKNKQTKRLSKKVRVDNRVIERVDISPKHMAIIDEYFNNGYNKSKAVMSVNKDMTRQSTAVHVFTAMSKKPEVKAYIEQKQVSLRAKTNLSQEQVSRELMNWAYSDATEFISLTEEEIKALPSDIRRCIQSFKTIERTETNREGNPVTTKQIEVKLVNKADALKELSKHIGYYEMDNKQRQKVIDLSKATPEQLNVLLSLATTKREDTKTIDI